MYIRKVLLAVVLSFSLSSLAMSETDNPPPDNTSPPIDVNQNQPEQASESSTPATANNGSSTQPPNNDKRPSMAEYCREHTC